MPVTPILAAALATATMQNVSPKVKASCDVLLIVGGAISTIAGWLPPLASLVAIVWGALNIYVLYRDKIKKP